MGYFRILYYISYIFNTVSRLIRRNKKFFMTLLIVGFILFMFLNNQSHAIYLGDDSYFDPYYAIKEKYDSICLDYIRRFDIYVHQENADQSAIDLIKQQFSSIDYYIYYQSQENWSNQDGGLSSINGSIYNTYAMYVVFYESSNFSLNIASSTYDSYYGINDNIREVNYTKSLPDRLSMIRLRNYELGYTVVNSYSGTSKYYIPQSLFHYQNKYIYEYFVNNMSLEQIELLYDIDNSVNQINESITNNEMTQEQEEETNEVIEDSQEIFDTEYSNDYHSYINSFYTSISNQISDYVANPSSNTYIDFTLPFVNYTYRIHSNSISTVLFLHDRTHVISNFITLFWWVAFSIPIFYLLRRIIIWFGTGEFINKPSKFAVYMTDFIDKNITPGMM